MSRIFVKDIYKSIYPVSYNPSGCYCNTGGIPTPATQALIDLFDKPEDELFDFIVANPKAAVLAILKLAPLGGCVKIDECLVAAALEEAQTAAKSGLSSQTQNYLASLSGGEKSKKNVVVRIIGRCVMDFVAMIKLKYVKKHIARQKILVMLKVGRKFVRLNILLVVS